MVPATDARLTSIITWMQTLIAPDQIVELRALHVPGRPGKPPHTESGFFDYDHLDDLARHALRLTISRCSGVYFTLNPLNPQILARRANRCEYARPSTLAHDTDVIGRRWLLVDCDPVRISGVSSTEEERGTAIDLATHVAEHLTSIGWPTPVLADSGNGTHLLYRVDLPAADNGLIKNCLSALASRFDTAAAKVDRSIFNPSRICKLYGTISRKGDQTPDRPYRIARVLNLPAPVEVVPDDLLRELAAQAPPEPSRTRTSPPRGSESHSQASGSSTLPDQQTVESRARAYLAKVPPAIAGQGGHNATFRAAMVLVDGFNLSPAEALPLLQEWNTGCQPPWSDYELEHKLNDAEKKRSLNPGYLLNESTGQTISGITCDPDLFGEPSAPVAPDVDPDAPDDSDDGFLSDFDSANPSGASPRPHSPGADEIPVNEADDDPHRLARVFLARHFTDSETGCRTLLLWREEWYVWDGAAYHVHEKNLMDAWINRTCKEEADRICRDRLLGGGAGRDLQGNIPHPFKVTAALVRNVRLALESMCACYVQSAPAWLTDENRLSLDPDLPPAVELLSTKSAILHLPRLAERPATPKLFNLNAIEIDHDHMAHCPEWLKFLNAVWPRDQESIDLLQEWFGYLLLPDTSQHKMLCLIGPTRSGKGTIGRVMKKLIGERNFCSPTLSSLSNPYGLWPLLGKTAALIADARLSGRVDAQVVIERLLSITGEDPQDVDRKFLSTVSGVRMPVRFTIMTNEMPNLADASGAIVRRMLILEMTESFYGREDRSLGQKLNAEIAGILNWAIDGWYRLRERGCFVQPESGNRLVEEMEATASPIKVFVEECCVVRPDLRVECDLLFQRWSEWCKKQGRHAGNQATFGRQLFAVLPKVIRRRSRQSGYLYDGIGFRPSVDGFD